MNSVLIYPTIKWTFTVQEASSYSKCCTVSFGNGMIDLHFTIQQCPSGRRAEITVKSLNSVKYEDISSTVFIIDKEEKHKFTQTVHNLALGNEELVIWEVDNIGLEKLLREFVSDDNRLTIIGMLYPKLARCINDGNSAFQFHKETGTVGYNSSAEVIKNKTQKEYFNKRGESNEGGEMDASPDKGGLEQGITPPVLFVPPSTALSPAEEQQPESPIQTVDSEILSTVSLTGEISFLPNDGYPNEIQTETSSAVAQSENKENVAHITSSQEGRGEEKHRKIIVLPNTQKIKLHTSENAWKPFYKRADLYDETAEVQGLYRKVRGILNKLTRSNLETLVEQVKCLDINTEEKLNGVVDLVFENAINEPKFSVLYALMAKQLALTIKVPSTYNTGQMVNFRKLLLTKCQKEFERAKYNEVQRGERMKASESADSDNRIKLQLEYDENEKEMRYRQLGNLRFIGELLKLNMLIEPIIHECIKTLLIESSEISLESVCVLLKTVGKELDEKGNGPTPIDGYIVQMKRIVDRRLVSSRVRFMLQDTIDLKENNWISRRDKNNPKTSY